MSTQHHQTHPSGEKNIPSRQPSAETTPDTLGQIVQHVKASPRSLSPSEVLRLQRTIGNQATMHLMSAGASVVQRESKVKKDGNKLSFFIDQFGANVAKLFTNATPDQVTQFVRDVNNYWRAAYKESDSTLDLKIAKAALKDHLKTLLQTLGKPDPKQLDYERVNAVLQSTFADDTDNLYGIATKKENIQKYPAGTEWWLAKVNAENLIMAEDKTNDARLMENTSQNHIVKTGADTASTATALFEVDQQNSAEDEINQDDRAWELHAHVTQDGDVEFAHTKADGEHMVTVNEWFDTNIDVTDRTWEDPA